jgi:dTDP-4-dehydrorhamnose reductase
MKVLVVGGAGLLAYALKQEAPDGIELLALGHAEFDLTNRDRMFQQLREHRPEIVINTAAYNAVDRCEIERELSWAVNAIGPRTLAELCGEMRCRLVHFGTDYVFDGTKREPYVEKDEPNPVNHYASGKLAGEQAVLGASEKNLVLRVSWLFGWHPTQTKSYVHTVLNLARKGQNLKATTDQSSVPTYVPDLAHWTFDLLSQGATGLLHAVNDEGLSRFEWTQAILLEAERVGLGLPNVSVEPVTTAYFNPTMRRPDYTVLSNAKAAGVLGRPLGSWRLGLREMLTQTRKS